VADALETAYRYLGHRDRTVAEMRRHLERRGAEPAAIDLVVAELSEQGYLDDTRYAQRFAEDRRTLDAWGAERIETALLKAGIERDVAAQAASAGAETEFETAVALLKRRWPTPPADDRERERALGLLVRRGYELELAYDAVRALGRQAA
jgi:regulatory protein